MVTTVTPISFRQKSLFKKPRRVIRVNPYDNMVALSRYYSNEICQPEKEIYQILHNFTYNGTFKIETEAKTLSHRYREKIVYCQR